MIYFYLIFLAALYMVVAIMVGKICAINSRWERSVDRLTPGRPREATRRKNVPSGRPAATLPLHAVGVGESQRKGTTF